jgi:hypothetical protein
MEIKPTYVTFKQAKKLKEKGFEIDTDEFLFCKDEVNNIEEHQIKNRDVIYNGGLLYLLNEDEYRIYEQWQVVEWLDKKYNQYIHIQKHTRNGLKCYSPFINNKTVKKDVFFNDFDTPQEAYSAAFDYILNNLL